MYPNSHLYLNPPATKENPGFRCPNCQLAHRKDLVPIFGPSIDQFCDRCGYNLSKNDGSFEGDKQKPSSKASSVPDEMNGEWYSSEYGYAFQLNGNRGTLTEINSPTQKVGDECFRITWVEGNMFKGEHGFVDDTWHPVEGLFVPPNQMHLSGRGLEWVLEKR